MNWSKVENLVASLAGALAAIGAADVFPNYSKLILSISAVIANLLHILPPKAEQVKRLVAKG